MLLVEPGREAKIGELDVTVLVDENVIRLDVAAVVGVSKDLEGRAKGRTDG